MISVQMDLLSNSALPMLSHGGWGHRHFWYGNRGWYGGGYGGGYWRGGVWIAVQPYSYPYYPGYYGYPYYGYGGGYYGY